MVLKNFIVLEGIDGSGTSTQMGLLKDSADSARFDFSAEPTGAKTGIFLRSMLRGETALDARTAAFLFAADRAEHIWGKGGIEEKASRGKICVSDRYLFSSLAYQSVSCGEELPRLLNSAFPLPELLFFLEIAPEAALSRIASRTTREIYEELGFLKKAAAAYDRIIGEYEKSPCGMKVVRIDATKSAAEIGEIIRAATEART